MGKERPVKLLTLDTETIDLDGALKRIAVYDGKKITYGYTYYDVLPIIESYYEQGFTPHVYIHNLDFDARKLPEIFYQGNIVWSRTKKIGNKYARIVCRKYVIHDSYKILAFSLKKLSKDFELTHGKLNLYEEVQETYPGQYTDEVDFLNRCDVDDPLYLRYLGYDVLSLYELIEKLIELSTLFLDDFVNILSTASLSRKTLRDGYNGLPFQESPDRKTDYELLTSCLAWNSPKLMKNSSITYQECELRMRDGFYGGRTEVFTPKCEGRTENGEKQIVAYHYDVNSLYPSVMIDNDFPIGYPTFEDDKRIVKFNYEKWMKYHDGLGFINATVYIPPQTIPPLPSRMGKLVFVTGYVRGTWTYNELEYAIKNCGVIVHEYHEQIHFKRTHKVFKRFVETFYEMKVRGKKEGNESLTSFAKLLLNTAYGWTVLRRDDKTALRDIKDIEKWKDKEEFLFSNEEIGYFEIRDKVNTESIQVQVGAYVTSYARLILLDALRKMSEKGIVYYCDTDSVVCSQPMPREMVDGSTLGKWDLEGELYSGLFIQPKVYFEDKKLTQKQIAREEKVNQSIKFKGITKKRQKELDGKFYDGLYAKYEHGEKGKFEVETGRKTLPSLAVAQRKNQNPNQFKITDKKINLETKHKRDIDFSENGSTPWHMESIEMFNSFSFEVFDNPPEGKNVFGG